METRGSLVLGVADLSVSVALWYVSLCLLEAAYTRAGGALAVSAVFAARLLASAALTILLGYAADKKGAGLVLLCTAWSIPVFTAAAHWALSLRAPPPTLLVLLALGLEAVLASYGALKYALPPSSTRRLPRGSTPCSKCRTPSPWWRAPL
ncbi:hypothetical protein [Thermofilum pendens]|uniref:hypothetical protein n=1 Tax=Thermofilum pendens TaxID=2269 RepID=UPI000699FE16|nr:hypothetical protein [Thermofilum pendens]